MTQVLASKILRPIDPSDCCVAQARVVVIRGGRRLDLCGHHFHQHEPALVGAGWSVLEDVRAWKR